MIILHNTEDAASRAFVAQYGSTEGATVLDWYNETERGEWLAAGGTLAISAFPSVLLRHDTYTVEDVTVAPGWDVVRTPTGIDPLPTEGQWVDVGLYTFGDTFLFARQAHERMHFEPHETPALFSVWRPDADEMVWIANEAVAVGDVRIYDGVAYRAIQTHTTEAGWYPPAVPALWEVVEEPGGEDYPEWVQPTGSHDAYNLGDRVTYQGNVWESTIDANVWEPGTGSLWVVVE